MANNSERRPLFIKKALQVEELAALLFISSKLLIIITYVNNDYLLHPEYLILSFSDPLNSPYFINLKDS